jgi:hypothetical protein
MGPHAEPVEGAARAARLDTSVRSIKPNRKEMYSHRLSERLEGERGMWRARGGRRPVWRAHAARVGDAAGRSAEARDHQPARSDALPCEGAHWWLCSLCRCDAMGQCVDLCRSVLHGGRARLCTVSTNLARGVPAPRTTASASFPVFVQRAPQQRPFLSFGLAAVAPVLLRERGAFE